MSYAKIENGKIKFPPRVLKDVERTFYDEDGEPITGLYNVGYDPAVELEPEVVAYLLAEGYLPVTEAPRPDDGDGYHYEDEYSMGDGEIVQSWERVDDPPPEPPEPTLEDGLRVLLGGVTDA